MKGIYVFKTSVKRKIEIKNLSPALNNLLKPNNAWNFDLEDRDKILRVEMEEKKKASIENLLHSYGFVCEEM
ncbi:hypothetical protein [Galbibacter mesophilus]|uniref:hypothetical protein n=1 Tax=Galbibacter mesophilus TaxID=379069 RepID=UPI001920300E|nr:hypothetical protein [Galbibacter mesophilus]MCM5663456.1 hypothetical protein [Galbibacter mesophilus]